MLRVDKSNVNDINIRYIELLKEAKLDCIFNDNIAESNIDQYGLHINESEPVILAKNLITLYAIQVYAISEKKGLAKKNLSLQLKWQLTT